MKMRMLIVAAFSIALLTSTAEATPRPPNLNSPEGTVLKLYRDYAWEAVMDVPGWNGLLDQPRKVLEQYFDEKLISLILKDRACASKEGMCRLSFDPVWDSQDPSAGDLKVEKPDGNNVVKVKFRFPTTDEKRELKYRLKRTKKGWRISDISGKDWSLVSILSTPE